MNDPVIDNPAIDNPAEITAGTLELRDIQLPDPISWWPLAPGWWLLLAAIILTLIIVFITLKHYRDRRHRRRLKSDIRTEMDGIKQRFDDTQDPMRLARSLSILMRRASISYYPDEDIAGLTGDSWLDWLDQTHTTTGISFDSETGRILLSAPYMPDDKALSYDTDSLISLCESWLLSTHSVPKADNFRKNDKVTSS